MAELVVKTQCHSGLRQATDVTLNVLFPVWGIASPLAVVTLILQIIGNYQSSQGNQVTELFAWLALCLSFTVSCLLAKRMIANDMMVIDQQGIRLPRLMGMGMNLRTYIPWKKISKISATTQNDKLEKSRLIITRNRGGAIKLDARHMPPEFVEQILLATEMWAPSVRDPSLEQLQQVLRIGARETSQKSYTDLWEEELGRRFCPTAYIPLEPGRAMRNNTLKVVSHLASGGLSALYLCQMNGKELVVLKEAVIPPDSVSSVKEKAMELFDREAKLLMKLDHPGIVHVLDCFTESERNYLLIEYINGADLRQVVKQNGPQSEAAVLEWAIQVASALKYLHEREQPIIHRDLTPDNLVLGNDGKVTIVDFGAANEFIGTATGTFVGKHSFIAPEQLRGKATVQSDIYAFGCTLHFLLTGQEPEALSTSNPKELVPTVSDELCELVQSCTEMEAADRYQSVAQLLPVLRRLAAQSIVV